MKEAIQKHGFVLGFFLGCDRLQRENSDPWIYRCIELNQKLIKYNPVPYSK
jgi:putative component of membrane protein insertase Oxa1/YidC/SpoIIIJ protein YidD